jgi:RecA/RadA recombinase
MSKYLTNLLSKLNNPDAAIVADGIDGADVTGFIDTGSYVLNALLSGSIYGGLPANKISCLAGDPATGKTFYAIGIATQFLKDNKDGVVIYFDTEQAITSDMFAQRGIDSKRIAVVPVATIEEFKNQALKIVNDVLETPEEDRKPIFMVLDSLGMLSTNKEMNDSAEGKDVRDMTKAQLTKATFRVLTLKLGKAKIPLLLTNHTYQVIGCMASDVNIIMGDSSIKNITNIEVGDNVKTLTGTSLVTEVFVYDSNETVEVLLDNGTSFITTTNHKFMTKDGEWKCISDIAEGDEIVSIEKVS